MKTWQYAVRCVMVLYCGTAVLRYYGAKTLMHSNGAITASIVALQSCDIFGTAARRLSVTGLPVLQIARISYYPSASPPKIRAKINALNFSNDSLLK